MTMPWPVYRKNHTTLKYIFRNSLAEKGNIKKTGRNSSQGHCGQVRGWEKFEKFM